MTLLAFAAERCAAAPLPAGTRPGAAAVDRQLPPTRRSAANRRTPRQRSHDGTDRRTDGRTHGRFISRPIATDAQLCRAWSTSSVDKAAEAGDLGYVSPRIDLGDRLPNKLLLNRYDALVVLQPVHLGIQRL